MKISFIIPMYNVEDYIVQCVQSLCNQTIKDIEIIVVDDGSTDKSVERVREIKDSRIKIVRQKNLGQAAARNKGLKSVNGEYIAFVDSDDFIGINNAYEDMYNIAIKDNSDMVYGNCIWYYSEENFYPQKRKINIKNTPLMAEKFFLESIKVGDLFIPVCFYLYKKDFLIKNNLLFMEGVYHEDEEFTPRALMKAKKISIYDKDFYIYRQRDNSTMHTPNKKKYNDILNVCLSLEKEIKNIENGELKSLFKNRIALTAILNIYKYRDVKVPKEIKRMINRNAVRKECTIRGRIISTNPLLYIKLEDINRKIKYILYKRRDHFKAYS